MQTLKHEISDVIYDPVEQTFRARVTLLDGETRISYPSSIAAPITMEFDRAAVGLVTQALRRHGTRGGLRSTMKPAMHPAVENTPRRGLPVGEYGYFRGRAA